MLWLGIRAPALVPLVGITLAKLLKEFSKQKLLPINFVFHTTFSYFCTMKKNISVLSLWAYRNILHKMSYN